MEESDQLHVPVVLPPENQSRYHFVGGLVGPQNRSGSYGEEKCIFTLSGIENILLIAYSQCRGAGYFGKII
jgi:hypothetical protein